MKLVKVHVAILTTNAIWSASLYSWPELARL
jgi:hypothetical protein